MTGTVALALVLTLSSIPIANIVCAAWCDARSSVDSSSASDVCHSEMAQTLFGVLAGANACKAFASTPFIREDTRRVALDTIPISVAFLSADFTVPEPRLNDVLAGKSRLPADHAQMLVLRI
jgi:hypothetical protein